jgi:shikimate kinase
MTHYPGKIFLIGFMGVGKSHWGRLLADQLSYDFIDLDDSVSAAAGGHTITQIFEQDGEDFFRQIESQSLEKHISNENHFVMACGGGAPCFLNNMDRMKRAGKVIWLKAGVDELLPRLMREKEKRPLISQLNEETLQAYILKKLGDRQLFYQEAHQSIQESSLSADNLIKTLLYE